MSKAAEKVYTLVGRIEALQNSELFRTAEKKAQLGAQYEMNEAKKILLRLADKMAAASVRK